MSSIQKVVLLGAGSLGTSLGNQLAVRSDLQVCILSIENDVVAEIENQHVNQKYFPNINLNRSLSATCDPKVLESADAVFICLPSSVIVDYIRSLKPYIPSAAVVANLSKGFGGNHRVISECLEELLPDNRICALKGPSFAREIINNMPTAFTLASKDDSVFETLQAVFEGTSIFIDMSTDVRGVEIISILKNTYAIVIGILDAHLNSSNLRFLIFTKAFNEMRELLLHFGGRSETMFNYCGIGDYGLTALNDMSRNRTLGLLIGKGFFTDNISEKVVLEGKVAMTSILSLLEQENFPKEKYTIMAELDLVFKGNYDISSFENNLLKHF